MAESITLRPASAGDEGFLYQVYASTRQEELAHLPRYPRKREDYQAWSYDWIWWLRQEAAYPR